MRLEWSAIVCGLAWNIAVARSGWTKEGVMSSELRWCRLGWLLAAGHVKGPFAGL